MTLTAFWLILGSVLLHALWHFLCKSGRPSAAFFSLMSLSLLCVMLPLLLISGINPAALPAKVLILAASGGLCGMLCDIGLSYAYGNSDISLAYPLARALPVLLTMLATSCFGFGEALDGAAWCGMLMIFAGCLMMAISGRRPGASLWNKGLAGILLAASATTAYTIVDSFGIKAIRASTEGVDGIFSAAAYSCMRETVICVALFAVALSRPAGRRNYTRELLRSFQPYVAGIFAAFAYLLVLAAMAYVSNVSYVQAFRQMSLPLGVLLGAALLKEKISRTRLAAVALILAGLAATVLR